MKKKKSSDQQPAEFKNTPFKSLKGLTPPPAAKESKPIPTQKRTGEKEEDAQELFLRAVSGARKIEAASMPISEPQAQKPPDESNSFVPQDEQLFLQAMKKIGTSFTDLPQDGDDDLDYERRSASSRMKQLKRGTIRVSSELDLHGFLRDEALKRLEQFIADAYRTGQQAVLVITGKGINSPEGPVLQGAVDSWLRESGKGRVAEFSPAPRDKGGSGAFVVFLKKK